MDLYKKMYDFFSPWGLQTREDLKEFFEPIVRHTFKLQIPPENIVNIAVKILGKNAFDNIILLNEKDEHRYIVDLVRVTFVEYLTELLEPVFEVIRRTQKSDFLEEAYAAIPGQALDAGSYWTAFEAKIDFSTWNLACGPYTTPVIDQAIWCGYIFTGLGMSPWREKMKALLHEFLLKGVFPVGFDNQKNLVLLCASSN